MLKQNPDKAAHIKNHIQLPFIKELTAKTALIAAQPKLTLGELKNSFIYFSFNDLMVEAAGVEPASTIFLKISHSQA